MPVPQRKERSPRTRLPPLLFLVAVSAAWPGACLAPRDGEEELEVEPYTAPTPADEVPTIGAFLMELDASLRYWTNLRLRGTSYREERTLRLLERELELRTKSWKAELLHELESPSTMNRSIAAIGLGFTCDADVTGPLLGALSDPNERVVNNALVGLGVLANPTTPLAKLCFLQRSHPEPWTRNNAAFAIQSIVAAGGRDDCVVESCQHALIDTEPGVRAQAASVLGMLVDGESVELLGDLLYDDVKLVSAAAAASLGNIGRKDPRQKAAVARLLVDSLERVEAAHRDRIFYELSILSREDYGDDIELWTEWAYRLQ